MQKVLLFQELLSMVAHLPRDLVQMRGDENACKHCKKVISIRKEDDLDDTAMQERSLKNNIYI